MIRTDVAILGGGWAGVLAAYFLKSKMRNLDVIIIEAASKKNLGGLMRSVAINGFVFDTGGSHIIFSRKKEVLKELLSFLPPKHIVAHRRKSFIYLNSQLVPYPFETGICMLSPEERAEIGVKFFEAFLQRIKEDDWHPKNLREWIYGAFGEAIARLYLEPYNQKLWKRDLRKIGVEWVFIPGRLPLPDWKTIIKSIAGVKTEGYLEQSTFYYPRYGGIATLYYSVLKQVLRFRTKILTEFKVSKLKRKNQKWIVNDSIEAKYIINTIPLRSLVKALNAPEHIQKKADKLDYNRVIVVGTALNKEAPNIHWVYVPHSGYVFHRYAWISNYSPENAPKGKSALIAEITQPPGTNINLEELKERTVAELCELGVMDEGHILFSKAWLNEYGYPVHNIDSSKYNAEIIEYLNQLGVCTIGRWGTWRYLNMDMVYWEVKEAIKNFVTSLLSAHV